MFTRGTRYRPACNAKKIYKTILSKLFDYNETIICVFCVQSFITTFITSHAFFYLWLMCHSFHVVNKILHAILLRRMNQLSAMIVQKQGRTDTNTLQAICRFRKRRRWLLPVFRVILLKMMFREPAASETIDFLWLG